MKKYNTFFYIIIILLVFIISILNVKPIQAIGENWLSGFTYRKSHLITNQTGMGTNYQIRINVYYGSGIDNNNIVYLNNLCQTDFDDVRFTNSDGNTELYYWRETYSLGSNGIFWIKLTDNLDSTNCTVYIYYGDSIVSTTSNGENTFIVFDHFSTSTLNSTIWSNVSTPTTSITSSIISTGSGTTSWKGHLSVTKMIFGRWRSYCKFPYGSGMTYGMHGLFETGDPNAFASADFYVQPSPNYLTHWRNGSGSETLGYVYDTNYHTFELMWKSTLIMAFQDDVSKINETKYVSQVSMGAGMIAGTTSTASAVKCDWVFLAKYIYPENIHSIWGSTEQQTFYVTFYMSHNSTNNVHSIYNNTEIVTNGSIIPFINITIRLYATIKGNISLSFENFTFITYTNSSLDNPYDYDIYENSTVWIYFKTISIGTIITEDYSFYFAIGFILLAIGFLIGLLLGKG